MTIEDKSICIFSIFFALFFCFGCSTSKTIVGKRKIRLLDKQIENSPVFSKNFTGFSLYDPGSKHYLISHQADKYFTPASNTKIFTLYSAIQIIKDSIPALKYQQTKDGMYFAGTGNPDLLHPYLPGVSGVIEFLQKATEPLYFVTDSTLDTRFGPGWAWDDFQWSYQPERSSLPMYGNIVQVLGMANSQKIILAPQYFQKYLSIDPDVNSISPIIWRDEYQNVFRYNYRKIDSAGYKRDIPYKTGDALVLKLLSELTGKPILLADHFPETDVQYLKSKIPMDSTLARMMQVSDNFLAEQLLLVCAGMLTDTLQTAHTIRFMKEQILTDLPDEPMWYDGSGLSRYNLFTPRSIVKLLEKIYIAKGIDWIKELFATGGDNGTIANWYYGPDDTPYIWAKTGTLRNKHALSGYLVTKKGKMYLFSFMHNNYVFSSSIIKKEMQKVLEFIYQTY